MTGKRAGNPGQLHAALCRLSDIEADDVSAPALEELNLFGCRQLGSAGLSALVTGCPALQILNLNGCSTLHELVMEGRCSAA